VSTALVDNDVLLKGAAYGLLNQFKETIGCTRIGVLGASRYVVSKRIRKAPLNGNHETVLANFERFLNHAENMEPTDTEVRFAADLEVAAQKAGVALDSGESLLSSIAVIRLVHLLLTGDKRAIQALGKLLDSNSKLEHLCGRVQCLEQLVLKLLQNGNCAQVRLAICSEPRVDTALTICFSCTDDTLKETEYRAGLVSYIGNLRQAASRILVV